MPGLVPGIHVLSLRSRKDVDGRNKSGHDVKRVYPMHDIRWIRDNPEAFDRALKRRNVGEEDRKRFSSQNVLSIDERRRAIIRVHEDALAGRNAASKKIAEAKRKGDEAAAQKLMTEVSDLKTTISRTDEEQKTAQKELDDILAEIPNLPADDVPDGKDASDNVERHRFGAKRDYAFAPKQHFDLGEALGQMDFETAAKLSGARFVVLKKGLARLERALGQFMLDVHTSKPHNYTEVAPPLLVRDNVMFGTGQLPKFAEDLFECIREFRRLRTQYDLQNAISVEKNSALEKLQKINFSFGEAMKRAKASGVDVAWAAGGFELLATTFTAYSKDFQEFSREFREFSDRFLEMARSGIGESYLIPTAEVPLTNLVRESIIDEAQLPMRVTACTPCFRAEAGAAGKDTRGMIRQHQFTKVELVSITTPEQSKDEHERMLSCAEEVLRRLELHYRVVTLCAGDMGFAAQKTYDIEVWLPGQGTYREISSCSNCGEFQARRMNARYRTKEGRAVRHVHTLNGSGVAVGRALIAVMETYQQEDGAIAVPEALAPYMGGIKKIEKQ
jgi:seryl-tRNA synthetase